jgi:hypothetical protein
MDKRTLQNRERGMALIMVLLALLVISAIGLGMMYMSNTDTAINANYKDTQTAFFAMRAGLEEMRDRMRAHSLMPDGVTSAAVPLPTAMPGTANSILYITNPAASETVDPTSGSYFDDEFCHEWFSGVTWTSPGPTVPCSSSSGLPTGVYTRSSYSPNSGTAAALKYKWVRLTLKQNGTFTQNGAFPNAAVDSGQPNNSQVCWNGIANQEVAVTSLGYTSCSAASAAGVMVAPVYLATALAVTPTGSRRIGQYETAAFFVNPPPSTLGLDGPGTNFAPASSNNFFISGVDSGVAGYAGPGGCTPSGPTVVPAVNTATSADRTTVINNLLGPPNRSGYYTGCTAAAACTTTVGYGSPAIVDGGTDAGGTGQFAGAWSSPSALNALAASLANAADVTLNCGIGSPCSGTAPYGTNASPQITFVNGDFNFGNASGAGVLIVTGSLNVTGGTSYNGLVLVIGQGIMNESGGGNGQYNGSIFLANTNSRITPYGQLAAMGPPIFNWAGGGTNGIQYNSCWANIGNQLHYMVVASREEMY